MGEIGDIRRCSTRSEKERESILLSGPALIGPHEASSGSRGFGQQPSAQAQSPNRPVPTGTRQPRSASQGIS